MSGLDLRFTLPIIINLFKFQSKALPSAWDAFDILNPNQTSWTNIFFHMSLLLFFSFTSITFILTRHPIPITALIRFRFADFSPQIAVSLVCSLVFPQALFWFMYPVLLILDYFLNWVNVNLSALPVWNLHITSSFSHHEETDIRITEPGLPMPQVNLDVSPEDGDSLAEG